MKVIVVSGKGGSKKDTVCLDDTATLADLKAAYRPHVSIHRKSFKLPAEPKPLSLNGDDKTLKALGVTDGKEVLYKDLGLQVGYRTVFVVEYAGPIAFMIMYASRPSLFYGSAAAGTALSHTQRLWAGLFLIHFLKREFETFFVHKFSRPTMPFFNIIKNSTYYWSFAAFIGYFLCHPQYTPATHGYEQVAIIGWAISELLNLAVHLQLSGMRPKEGDTSRRPPSGGLFSLCSCPNYTFEVLGWVFYSFGTNIAMSWVFTLVGFLQMTDWALKKHKGYVKSDPAMKRRKAIVPFLI